MSPTNRFLLYIAIAIGGVLIEIIISKLFHLKIKKTFQLRKYLLLLFMPLLAVLYIFLNLGTQTLVVFFSFAFIGMFLEWCIGFSYHMVMGHRLWTYHILTLSGYTSWITIPLWGFAGVMFWLLALIFVPL